MPIVRTATPRLLAGVVATIVFVTLFVAPVRADDPGPTGGWWVEDALTVDRADALSASQFDNLVSRQTSEDSFAQQAPTCDQVRFTDVEPDEVGLILSDAHLNAESNGSRLCIFFDYRWGSYEAWTLNQRSIEEFRRTKAQLQPLLAGVGVDPCQIAFWNTFDAQVRRQISLSDRFDAGKPCVAEVISHGPNSDRRLGEVRDAVQAANVTAAQVFRWSLSWPLRVHVYDTQDEFFAGLQREGGYGRSPDRSLESVHGATRVLANGQFGFLLDAGYFPSTADLRRVVAHEFAHVAQAGLLGGTGTNLPFFAVEGGAEYFASLVVGADHPSLAGRFQEAVNDEHANRSVPLRELVQEPSSSDGRRQMAAYSRGYAAMVMLTERWGRDSFTRLHMDNVGGSPEQFLAALTRLTGRTLDEFDGELRSYLLARPVATRGGTTTSRAMLVPDSLLSGAFTARRGAGSAVEPAERFSAQEAAVVVMFDWNCLPSAIRGEARVIAPDGRRFATFGGTSGPGCNLRAGLEFPLTSTTGTVAARDLPGTWTVEFYADNVFQGSITFMLV
jgi:hypothetical protein